MITEEQVVEGKRMKDDQYEEKTMPTLITVPVLTFCTVN